MSKKVNIIDDEPDNFDPTISASKLPANISRGRSPRQDYLDIPITQIVPFQGKGKGDFSRMEGAEFDSLVESVREDGILEATIVRTWADDKFELLAGETRWRAARAAGLQTIPARIIANCSDARAARIFSITNLNRRNPTIRDRLYGWYTYWVNTKSQGKTGEKLLAEDLADVGGNARPQVKDIQIRQIQKYYKIYDVMEEPYLQAIEKNIISIDAAYALAFLTKDQRAEVLGRPMTVQQAEQLKTLSKRGEWSEETVAQVLGKIRPPKPEYETSMRKAVSNFRKIITSRLNPAQYNNVDKILDDALELYFTAHPEAVIKS